MDVAVMNDTNSVPSGAPLGTKRSFAAMRHPGFRVQFITFVLAMMADNIEHVISYWMVFQKFHSPALAGFGLGSPLFAFLRFSVGLGGPARRAGHRPRMPSGMW